MMGNEEPNQVSWPVGKVGYVALLGRPNTGKSTFLNMVLDYHLCAVSAKPQTTRRKCLCVLSDEHSQILFLDAPGVHEPKHALDQSMSRAVDQALDDADAVLCMADATRPPGAEDTMVAQAAAASGKTVLLAVNKVDVATEEQIRATSEFYCSVVPDASVHRISAIDGRTLPPLLDAIRAALPEGPFFYPQDTLTDVYERSIGAELIRESLLEYLREELPHSMAVTVESWKEQPDRRCISAIVYVEHSRHRGMVLGHKGRMIRKIRTSAQKKLEALCGVPVDLELWVKVLRDWRRKKGALRELGLG